VPFVTKCDIFFDVYIITLVDDNATLVRRPHDVLANAGTRDIIAKVEVDGLGVHSRMSRNKERRRVRKQRTHHNGNQQSQNVALT